MPVMPDGRWGIPCHHCGEGKEPVQNDRSLCRACEAAEGRMWCPLCQEGGAAVLLKDVVMCRACGNIYLPEDG